MSLIPVESPDNDGSPEHSHELRAPKSLQELLRLSTSLHTTTGPNDSTFDSTDKTQEERKEFLKKALTHMSVDVVNELKKLVKIIEEIKNDPEPNQAKYESALENIHEQVYSIDMANVFYQIGGLMAIIPLLNHKFVSLRWMAASVIAECCQNNPYCQKLSTTDNVFCPLMELATINVDSNTQFKAISAISAIVRNNPHGIKQFRKYEGFSMLQNALNSRNEKIISKISYFIMALCDTDDSTKDDLIELGIIETLICLARLSDDLRAEYCLRALLSVMRNHSSAIKESMRNELELLNYLEKIICDKQFDEASKELVECAQEILALMNTYEINS